MPPIVLKKKVPTTPTTSPVPKAPSAGKPTALPKKTPAPNKELPKKEEPKNEPKTKKPKQPKEQPKPKQQEPPRESRESKEAPKPVVSSGEPAQTRKHRFAVSREELPEYDEQLTHLDMLDLSFTAKHDLWKKLNKNAPYYEFVTLLKPWALPKDVRREFPPSAAVKPSKEALWCPYCAEWMKFRTFSYTGYDLCIGCSISTRDFHVSRANKLFN